jgi:hypothetical protein
VDGELELSVPPEDPVADPPDAPPVTLFEPPPPPPDPPGLPFDVGPVGVSLPPPPPPGAVIVVISGLAIDEELPSLADGVVPTEVADTPPDPTVIV